MADPYFTVSCDFMDSEVVGGFFTGAAATVTFTPSLKGVGVRSPEVYLPDPVKVKTTASGDPAEAMLPHPLAFNPADWGWRFEVVGANGRKASGWIVTPAAGTTVPLSDVITFEPQQAGPLINYYPIPSNDGGGSSALQPLGGASLELGDEPLFTTRQFVVDGPGLSINGEPLVEGSVWTVVRLGDGWTGFEAQPSWHVSLGGPPDPSDVSPPSQPSLSVDSSSQSQLVAVASGSVDDVGVSGYRYRIDGGSWQSSGTFTGLVAGSQHTIDAQAGDAAGNWSVSASWSGSTASAPVEPQPVVLLLDTFTSGGDSGLHGKALDVGGTWTAGYGWAQNVDLTGNTLRTVNGRAVAFTQGDPNPNYWAAFTPTSGDLRITCDYTVATQPNTGVGTLTLALGSTEFSIDSNGTLTGRTGGGNPAPTLVSGSATNFPKTGTLTITKTGGQAVLAVDGVTRATYNILAETVSAVDIKGSSFYSSWIDNYKLEKL